MFASHIALQLVDLRMEHQANRFMGCDYNIERLYSPMNRRPSGRRRRTTEHRRWATRDAFDIAVRIDARHPVLPVHRHVEVVVRIEGYTIAADETRVGHPHLLRACRGAGLHREAPN